MVQISPMALLGALDLWDSLATGDQVLTRFGSNGSQAAIITGRTAGGYVMARKYRAKSRSYTNPVRVHPGDVLEIISRATTKDT